MVKGVLFVLMGIVIMLLLLFVILISLFVFIFDLIFMDIIFIFCFFNGVKVDLIFFLDEFFFMLVIKMSILEVLVCIFDFLKVLEVVLRVIWGDVGGVIFGINVMNFCKLLGFICFLVKLNLVDVLEL